MVILDDKFGSIVKAIIWGRTVYDNIRMFLQFQLTVNVVALLLVFIGAVAGFGQPLNAVMMLWVSTMLMINNGERRKNEGKERKERKKRDGEN